MFCRKCGTKLEDGAAFCHNCGTPAEEIEVEAVTEVTVPEKVVETEKETVEAEPDTKEENSPKSKQKKKQTSAFLLS